MVELEPLTEAVTVGVGFTSTVILSLFSQPFELVPVTIYLVVVVGLAVTEAAVVEFNPVDGLHT